MRIRIKPRTHLTEWHDKFIWFPMVIRDSDTGRRFWVWLETVRRKLKNYKKVPPSSCWQYRLKDKKYENI